MDANGTRFHLLLGQDDWSKRSTLSGVEWNEACGDVALVRRPYEFPASPGDHPPKIDDRRGAARDAFGNWYWINESQAEIVVRSSGSGVTSLFWSPAITTTVCEERDGAFEPLDLPEPPRGPAALRGLVVTAHHYLIVGTLEPNGLLVFDLHAGGAPQHLCWPPLVAFSPFDMTPSDANGAWILDRDNSCVWALDAACRVVRRSAATMAVAETFVPADGAADPARTTTTSAPLNALDAWPAPANSVAIESLPGGALVILDRPPAGASTVHYCSALGEPASRLPLDSHHIIGHDIAYAGIPIEPDHKRVKGLLVVTRDGNQAHAFTIGFTGAAVGLTLVPQYFPMRLFGGKGLVGAGGDAYYDFNRTWIPLITQSRPRHGSEGRIVVKKLDGREPDCVWHRLLIDGSIPSDASVECWTRAANSQLELATAPWQKEPRPYLRSQSELPYAPGVSGDGAGTWELLFQNAKGQWLDLQIRLTGNGRSTPRLRAVRIYYPRFSYLQYLPAVYREDVDSAGFLDRFLANVEGTLTSIEDRIAASQALIDVRSAPPEALEWLASWVGLALDSTWDDRKRRLLLQHAPIVFARRGTIDGLRTALALSLFDCATPEMFTDAGSRRSPAAAIRIIEQFRTRRVPAVVSGDPTQLTGIREVSPEARWTPKAGRDVLDLAWGDVFPLVPPSERDRDQAWRALAMQTLGFVPAVADAGAQRWRQFLAGRYHGVSSYNEVYGATGHARIRSFDEVTPPVTLPPDGAPLLDWYEFETRVLAMTARAHQFLVLLPVSPDAQADAPEHQRALDIARRVTAIEKPAHTTFDVRFYWALFRVGEVRLGLDTLIARRPSLLTPFVLDRAHLAESYLAPSHPQDARDRSLVIGRGRLEPPCTTGEGS